MFIGIINYNSTLNAAERGLDRYVHTWELWCSHVCCLLACDPVPESSQPVAALGVPTLSHWISCPCTTCTALVNSHVLLCSVQEPVFGLVEHTVSQMSNNLLMSFSGQDDVVRCFYCDGGVRNWSFGDDPWREHAKWYPG